MVYSHICVNIPLHTYKGDIYAKFYKKSTGASDRSFICVP
jgi:hypothetical protein